MPAAAEAVAAVVTSRTVRELRVRVCGLLRNRALAQAIESRWPGEVDVRPDTGVVKVQLSVARGEAAWLDALSAAAHAHNGRAPRPVPPPLALAAPREVPAAREAAHEVVDEPRARTRANLIRTPRRTAGKVAQRPPTDLQRGLSQAEAAQRLVQDGPNEIEDVAARSAWQILLDQFRSVPVALLGASSVVALGTRAFADAAAIGAVLATNGGIGFMTERQAEETVSSLRRMRPRRATVLRDGEPVNIDAREVVVGDVLVLQPGEPVAADARVIESHRLATNEAALTGESLPVRKEPLEKMPEDTPIGERRNMVFLGTVVSGGTGRALVLATAERTELGRIRRLAQEAQAPGTRLQNELDHLGRRLAIGAGLLCLGVFGIGLLRGRALLPLLRTTVSLGVAAIPEGLPTVATSLLATTIRDLQRREVFVRRLDAVENLGAIDTVCLDKTGTLTFNRMSVASLSLGLQLVEPREGERLAVLPEAWLRVAVLCNSVERNNGSNGSNGEGGNGYGKGSNDSGSGSGNGRSIRGEWEGSSTEVALLEFAVSQGADAEALRRSHPTLGVRHRSEHHPYMVTMHESKTSGLLVAVKGRPDEVLARCETWFDGRAVVPLSAAQRRRLLALNDEIARRGQRVLALAFRQHPDRKFGETGGLSWLGMVGLADPLRPGLPQMVRRFKAAGIRPLMITGDQPPTAQAVAESIELDGDDAVLDASRLPESAEQIADAVGRASGFARTSPAMKLQIVRALQLRGHVVAMTGDGINDGPALKTADVGVAMGDSGTDFAHAMSDVVLRDDHPAAMLAAIERGRTTLLNVKKSVRYLVSTNLSELAATAVAVGVGLPDPLDPLALLWTNIATDVWPAIALGMEPAEPGTLQQPPVSLRQGLLEPHEWRAVATDAGVMALITLASFGYGLARYGPGPRARTLAFCALTSSQLLYAFSMRSKQPLRAGGLAPNPMLSRAVGWTLAAQAGTVLLPFARRFLHTSPIGLLDAAVVAAAATLPLLTREFLKERGA